MKISAAKAIRDVKYTPHVQPISGYVLGHDRSRCWRVSVRIGRRWFNSKDEYESEDVARRAARTIEKEIAP